MCRIAVRRFVASRPAVLQDASPPGPESEAATWGRIKIRVEAMSSSAIAKVKVPYPRLVEAKERLSKRVVVRGASTLRFGASGLLASHEDRLDVLGAGERSSGEDPADKDEAMMAAMYLLYSHLKPPSESPPFWYYNALRLGRGIGVEGVFFFSTPRVIRSLQAVSRSLFSC